MTDGTTLLVAALIAIGVWLGGEAVHGAKVVAHKTKCGISRMIGHPCDPPEDSQP